MPESVGQSEDSRWEQNLDSASNPHLPAENLELEMLTRASKLVLRRNEPQYELASVLEEIMDGLQALVPYESGTIHRLDPKDDQFRAITVRGKDAEIFVEQLIPLHNSLIGHALLTRQPYIYNNLREHPKLHILPGNKVTLAALLIAPLALDSMGGGWVICIRRFETPLFSERNFQLFKIFANYADAAIQNTQLYQAAIRDAKTLREVNEIMQSVSAVLEPYEVCQRVAAGVASMLEYERLAVLMIDLNKETVRCEFNTKNPEHLNEIISPLRGSVMEYVNRTGKTFVREDTAGQGNNYFPEDAQLLKDLVRSYIVIPLRTESELTGVIMLTSYWPSAFDETSINFMQILTIQFATVMQNALLFERLSRTKHEWKLTLDAIPDAMMLVDATDLTILQANFGTANMVGSHPDELIGRTCREVFYTVEPGLADFPLEELKPDVSGFTEEKTGSISGKIYQRSIYPIFGTDKKLSELVVHIRDITENKLLTQQLAENARLKAVGEMASGIAHDFNNSLTGILGNVELMLVETTDPAQHKQLKQLKQAALDSADTVKRIQSFGKREGRLTFQAFDLSEAAREVIELTRPRWQNQSAQKGIYIGVVQKLSNKVEVWGSAAEIKEVITNLLFNAIDAMPNGGTVTISSSVERIGRGSKMG
jgi:GAF domain-containing protein